MGIVINGTEISDKIKEEIKMEVLKLKDQGIEPKLAVIMVGDDSASRIYVSNKSKACEDVGIKFEECFLDSNIQMEDLVDKIIEFNRRDDIHGILIQSPLPSHLDRNKAFEIINFRKDVDGFNPINIGRLSYNNKTFISCTAHGILKLLEGYDIPISGSNVVIVGRSNIVGKPLAQLLLNKDATVTVCHSKTKNLKEITRMADILISAAGRSNLITDDMVKDNAVVIDVGINRTENGIEGDVDFNEVQKKASYITPVPGGVGPVTIAMLLYNVVLAAKDLNGIIEE